MSGKKATFLVGLATLLLLAPAQAMAAGSGGAPLVIVADTRNLTGILAWWANLYNASHLFSAILTVILIPTVGIIFGLLADLAMQLIGIDLSSRDLAEH
mgnify:CR=1 FL=1